MAKTSNQFTFTTDDPNLAGSIMQLMLGGGSVPTATPAPVAQAPAPVAAPAPVTPAPATPPPPVAPPAAVAPPPPAAPAEPRGEPAPGWTIEHVKAAVGALATAKGLPAVAEVLGRFHASKVLTNIDPAQWHLVHQAATEAAG